MKTEHMNADVSRLILFNLSLALGQVLQRIGTNHAGHTQKKPTCECLEQMVKEPLYKFVRMKGGNQNVEYCCRHSGHEGER